MEGETYSSPDMNNVSLLKIGIDFKCHHTDCTSSLTAYSKAALKMSKLKNIMVGNMDARTLRQEAA